VGNVVRVNTEEAGNHAKTYAYQPQKTFWRAKLQVFVKGETHALFLHKSTHHPSRFKKKKKQNQTTPQTLPKVVAVHISASIRFSLVTLIRQNCKDFSNEF